MRVTRNADIDAHDLYDEDMDYRDMMEQLIKKRVRLDPVRVELSRKINDEAKRELSNFLEIGTSHIINVKTPLDLSFVFTLQNYLRDQKELFYEKRSPRETPALSMHESILSQVEKKDVLLSYPFESMKPFIKMLNDAAEDPDVVSIKMTITTLAPLSEAQKIDGLDANVTSKRYMHHYNFPSYSVGETKPSRGPGRREIGHGALAERALVPVLA